MRGRPDKNGEIEYKSAERSVIDNRTEKHNTNTIMKKTAIIYASIRLLFSNCSAASQKIIPMKKTYKMPRHF